MYGVRTEETMADPALINRYDYDGIFGTGGWGLSFVFLPFHFSSFLPFSWASRPAPCARPVRPVRPAL